MSAVFPAAMSMSMESQLLLPRTTDARPRDTPAEMAASPTWAKKALCSFLA